MWVLEPRENAEKVGYPIVWEEIKEASNVIDYQINEEITKDASWVINTNNVISKKNSWDNNELYFSKLFMY